MDTRLQAIRMISDGLDQRQSYRNSALPPQVPARIAVEQGSILGWNRYVDTAGKIVSMKTFGASAPLKELQRKFGFQPERILELATKMLGRKR